jgi:hypothetical protein
MAENDTTPNPKGFYYLFLKCRSAIIFWIFNQSTFGINFQGDTAETKKQNETIPKFDSKEILIFVTTKPVYKKL